MDIKLQLSFIPLILMGCSSTWNKNTDSETEVEEVTMIGRSLSEVNNDYIKNEFNCIVKELKSGFQLNCIKVVPAQNCPQTRILEVNSRTINNRDILTGKYTTTYKCRS